MRCYGWATIPCPRHPEGWPTGCRRSSEAWRVRAGFSTLRANGDAGSHLPPPVRGTTARSLTRFWAACTGPRKGAFSQTRCTKSSDSCCGFGQDRRARRPIKDRKSAVEGKRGSVRVDLGGRRIIKKKINIKKEI